MGVYIEGMEMPMGGRILIVFPSGRVLEVSADATQDIFRETQAVSVPSHGRLIEMHDVFKLISAFPEVDQFLPVEFMKALYNLPTIISASEEGK